VNDASLRDYKDNEVPKGIYTARFELQPKDGDHLGTAEFDSFLVLTDVQNDKELNGLNTFKALTKGQRQIHHQRPSHCCKPASSVG
jgi:hypothetical protein